MPAAVPAETAPAPVFTDAQPPTDSKPNPTTPAVGPAFQPSVYVKPGFSSGNSSYGNNSPDSS